MFWDYFLVLKLFPGDPILNPLDFRDPLLGKNAAEFLLLGGGGGAVFINTWTGLSLVATAHRSSRAQVR